MGSGGRSKASLYGGWEGDIFKTEVSTIQGAHSVAHSVRASKGSCRLLTLTLRWTLRKVRSGSKQRSPWSAGAPPSSCQVLLSASCARTTYPSRRSAGEGLSLETRKTRKTRPGEVQELTGPHSLDSDPGVSDASPQSQPQARTAEDTRANETGAPRPDGGGRRQTTGRGAPGC